jgi:hypothetical protein
MTEELRDSAKAWVEANYPALEDKDLDAAHYRYGDNPAVDQRTDVRAALEQLIEEVLPGGNPQPKYAFQSDGWFNIEDRGDVAVIKNPEQVLIKYDIWDPANLVNRWVSIDGKPYRVMGAETFLINRSPKRPYRMPFSLLVKQR